jgi:hypothetical protein
MIHPWTRTRPIWWPAPRLCLSRKEYMPVASGYCRCPLSVGTLAAGRRLLRLALYVIGRPGQAVSNTRGDTPSESGTMRAS